MPCDGVDGRRTSSECLSELLNRAGHRVEDALQVVEKLLELVRRHGPFGRWFDQPFLLQDPQGVAHLVLGKVEQFRESNNPDRLVLHDGLEHRDMSLQELDLGLDLAGQRAPPSHEKRPPTNRDMVRDNVGSLKRFDARMMRRTPCPDYTIPPSRGTSRQ